MSGATNIGQSSNKRKRACDYCKAKRVICHPHPDGCPRCIEKGVRCVTTVVPRRTRTKAKKADIAQFTAASPEQEAESSTSAANRCNTLALRMTTSSHANEAASKITYSLDTPSDTIPAALIQDALESASKLMVEHSLLFPVRKLRNIMQRCDWDVRLIAPQERVLTFCFLALASLVSVDPFYVGYDDMGHEFPDTHLRWENVSHDWMSTVDIRELGRRRQPICARFYGEAIRQAHNDGITSLASLENASSCFLLSILDVVHDSNSAMPWASAFVWQLRTMAETAALDALRGTVTRTCLEADRTIERVQWRGSLVRDFCLAVGAYTDFTYSEHDEVLICGPEPKNIDDLLARVSEYSRHYGVVEGLHSMGARCIRLTRDAIENVVGLVAFFKPLDELEVARHVSAIEKSYATVARFRRFIHSLGGDRELRLGLYSTSNTFTSLAVAMYRALRRRRGVSGLREAGPASRMTALCRRSRTVAARSVVETVQDLRSVAAAHWIGLFQAGGLAGWAEMLFAGDNDERLDDFDISAEERVETLTTLLEMMRVSVFTGLERTQIVEAITAEIDAIRHHAASRAFKPTCSPPSDGSTTGTPGPTLVSGEPLSFGGTPFTADSPMVDGDLAAAAAAADSSDALALAEWWDKPLSDDIWGDMMDWMNMEGCPPGSV
ncbi:hypothetical protein HDZ31DRAFT_29168 [Schizophyllum fasciatum]